MSDFLSIPSINVAAKDYPPPDPAISYSFPLDPWQQQAVMAIHRGDNVFVTAKTGSGKTLVGEYQIAYCLARKQRVFYTTPIKSLSNQKFYDLKHLFPSASVGIMTGDIKCNPEADIVIMTTEILRNLLYKQSTTTASIGTAGQISLTDVGAVVFDEVHYINDPDRGHVWEETLILLPPSIKLILLSATIDSSVEFAQWLGAAKQHPIVLLQTSHRIVPLVHGIYDPVCKPLPVRILKNGDEAPFSAATYAEWLRDREKRAKSADDWQARVKAAKAAGDSIAGASGKVKLQSFTHTLNEAIDTLKTRNLLPALFFQFSRKSCETYAAQVTHTLIDSTETAAMKHIVSFHLHRYAATLEKLPQYHQLMPLLERGIAFHHSGLLPLLKEIVELLFSRGYIKVLFCTETFAVGLNMPARTVVFCDLKKPADNGSYRPLRPDEYIQMAGRAGRRGKDTQGLVIYLPARNPVEPDEIRTSLSGPLQSLKSRLQFHYEFVLKAIHAAKADSSQAIWSTIMDASYMKAQQNVAAKTTAAQIVELETQLAAIPLLATDRTEIDEAKMLETQIASSTNAARRKAQQTLDRWKERHAGPKWASAIKLYDMYIRISTKIAQLKTDLENAQRDTTDERIQPILNALKTWDACVQNESQSALPTLTQFGLAATEVNEANPILLAKLYESNLLKDASPAEIVGVLGAFIVDREAQEKSDHPNSLPISLITDRVKSVLLTIDDWCMRGLAIDKQCAVSSPEDYWSLTTLWTCVGTEWMNGASAAEIAVKYELFEGNLMKGLLKLTAILNEWICIATLKSDVEMLEKLKNAAQTMYRDIAEPQSLYLRL